MTVVAGAYPAAPAGPEWDRSAEEAFLRTILAHEGVDGLELPFVSSLHAHDEDWLLGLLPAGSRHVVTTVPITMMRAKSDAGFGLASVVPEGRRQAIALVAEVRDSVERVTQRLGEAAVVAVELQTAPIRTADPHAGTADALAEALAEIAGWDWSGAGLVIEHCDAPSPDHPAEKGFLILTDEIAAVRQVDAGVGISLNWARSAIEGRSVGTVLDHVAESVRAGLLRGLIFSGATDVGDAAWADGHLPPRPGNPASLLGIDEIADTLRAVGDTELAFLGTKVVARPTDRTAADRAAGVCAAVDELTRSRVS